MHVKRLKGSLRDGDSFQPNLYLSYQLSDKAIEKDAAFDSTEDHLYLLAGTSVCILYGVCLHVVSLMSFWELVPNWGVQWSESQTSNPKTLGSIPGTVFLSL